jgi:hypothetical protein
MRRTWCVFLAAVLAADPGGARADNQQSTCVPTCSGATLQVTYNGCPLGTWLGANLSCAPTRNGNGCKWCFQISTLVWNQAALQWQPGGNFMTPAGPSSQSQTVGSTCNATTFLETFNPTWGTPFKPLIWVVNATVSSGPCGSGGRVLEPLSIEFVTTS